MIRHPRVARVQLACAVALALAFVPVAARAGTGPTLSPSTIVSEGFESAPPPRLTLDWVVSAGYPTSAYWGRITQQKHSGSYGLWCAGSIPNSGSTSAWTTFGGFYPSYTAGLAYFDLPELADYYAASLDYWYRMPSIGSEDGHSFNVMWQPAGGGLWDFHYDWPVTSQWTHVAMDLTAPTPGGDIRPIDLSRTASTLKFLFMDSADSFGESPTNGEGPTIDDVTVSGYKYGPVRNLSASLVAGDVNLAWRLPARSTVAFAPDEERPVTYRVWRSPDTSPAAWTEITTLRIVNTALTDTEPLDGASLYLVQAWDPGDGSGYGEVDVGAAAHVLVVPPIPVSTITVTGGTLDGTGAYTTMPVVTVSRDSVRGTTYYRWDSGGYASSTSMSFEVPALGGSHTLEVYSVNSLNMPEVPTVTRVITVAISAPGPAPISSILINGAGGVGGTYTATPTIAVSRDQGDATTYYRWDSVSFVATSSASFQLLALAGTHTLEVYSVSTKGVLETPPVIRTITVSVPVAKTKPSLSTPTLSTTYVRHNKSFSIRGSIKPNHATSTSVKLYLYRYYSGAYHWYRTYSKTVPAGATSYSLSLSLPRTGTWRVKSGHSCALHLSTFSSYRKFTVHT